jgi:alkylation response protein AidB-like acyl-CoA dehydrogenase
LPRPRQFAREEILPLAAAIEAKEPGVLASLLRKAAELGFTSVDIPEEYGGMGMDKITSALIADHLSILASVSTAFGAHTGIATLPLVWYGTEEQKQRYLPKLATAEWIGSYGLSEASSGSDAMNVRTRATPLARRRPLHPQRREDVDHQLRNRQPLYGVRQN